VRFFRRHSEMAALALLALLVQGIAAFGHVHTLRAPSPDLALQCRTIFKPAADGPCPTSDRSEKGCPICWAVAQANAAVVPVPPTIDLPPRAHAPDAPLPRGPLVTAVQTAPFEARGPPGFRRS